MRETFEAGHFGSDDPLAAAVSNRERMRWSNPAKAPLTMKRMCRVLMVSGWAAPLPRIADIALWICAFMSLGDTTGTSPSSISLSRLVWTPRPETSRPPLSPRVASLSTSSR